MFVANKIANDFDRHDPATWATCRGHAAEVLACHGAPSPLRSEVYATAHCHIDTVSPGAWPLCVWRMQAVARSNLVVGAHNAGAWVWACVWVWWVWAWVWAWVWVWVWVWRVGRGAVGQGTAGLPQQLRAVSSRSRMVCKGGGVERADARRRGEVWAR